MENERSKRIAIIDMKEKTQRVLMFFVFCQFNSVDSYPYTTTTCVIIPFVFIMYAVLKFDGERTSLV